MSFKLYSITYDPSHSSQFERYDNSHIKTPEQKSYLFEYNPIIDIARNRRIEEEYLGIFSYKFAMKCGMGRRPMTEERLMRLLCENPGKEIYGLSGLHSPSGFGFDFAEKSHPGFSEIFFPLCEDLGLTIEEPDFMINSNFFIAKTEIYRRYVEEAIVPAIELLDGKYRELAWRPCVYAAGSSNIMALTGITHYTFHSFVLERLIGQYRMTKNLEFRQLNTHLPFYSGL